MPHALRVLRRFQPAKHPLLYILLALVAVFFLPYIFRGHILLLRDFFYYYYPDWIFYRECLMRAAIPLWTPYTGCGEPFLANTETAVLYLPTLLFLLLPVSWGSLLYLIVHFLLAAAGTYWLCRVWEISERGAFLASLSFVFSAAFIVRVEFISALASLSWYPLIIALYAYWLIVRKRWIICVLGVFVAFQFYAGWPEAVLFTGMTLVIYALVAGFLCWRKEKQLAAALAPIGCLIVVFITAALLAMAQALPQWELVSRSALRGAGADPRLDIGSVHPLALFTLFIPSLYGVPGNCGRYWSPSVFEHWLGALYVGIVPLVIFLTAGVIFLFGTRTRKTGCAAAGTFGPASVRVPFLIILLAFSFLYAMGKYTPLFLTLWETVPVLQKFRWPAKMLFCSVFSICCLAGVSFDWILRQARLTAFFPRWRSLIVRWGTVVIAGVLGSFALICALNTAGAGRWVIDNLFNLKTIHPYYIPGLPWKTIVSDCALFSVLAPCAAGLLAGYVWGTRRRELLWCALIALIVCDLFAAGYRLLPSTDPDILDNRTVFPELTRPEGSVVRFHQPRFIGRFLYGENSPQLYRLARASLFGGWAQVNRTYNVESHGNTMLGDYHRFLRIVNSQEGAPEIKKELLRMVNCGTFVSLPKGIVPYITSRIVPVRFVQIDDPLPRAFVVGRVEMLHSRDDVFRSMRARLIDYAGVALVSADDCPPGVFRELASPGRIAYELKEIIYGCNKVTARIRSEAAGLLVLTDTYYPGWLASVNGQAVPLYRVNGTFRGVLIPAGESVVCMTYRPLSFLIGSCVSLTTLAGLILYFLGYVWRVRREHRGAGFA